MPPYSEDCSVARIKKMSITLCALLFSSLAFSPLSHASGHTKATAAQKSLSAKGSERKKKNTVSKSSSKKKSTASTSKKTTTKATASKKTASTASKSSRTARTASTTKTATTRRGKSSTMKTAAANVTTKCVVRKGHKKSCTTSAVESKPLTIAEAHKARVQKAQKTAMNKLMDQIGKPYRWGGTSPRTGFDCSGLVYYAYKDLVKFRIPRTANEMYHLRDARAIDRGELESGDLVFFRTRGRGTADHVGVYIGGGKFIQSPRTGRDIQITSLSEDYWDRHYVGARRVMTPKTIR
ncbi:cell wall-associated hydrolase, invasion-associated protein [Enterobacteriaceae bacterium strain FGI 57]|nr:cell wall-associated hydrolase, invasion-associated protein [Enterobacteriaceae bacterium strain FGI 57]